MNSRLPALLSIASLAAAAAFAGRYKLSIDPESKPGFVLQQIRQERSPARKIEMMIQFADEHPADENLPWILDQLLPFYAESKSWNKLLAAGDKLLAANPADHDAAYAMLRAAEALGHPDIVKQYAAKAWKSADLATESAKPRNAAEVPAWQRDAEQARNSKLHAEYAVFALAKADGPGKQDHLAALERLNPRSVYLIAARQAEHKSAMTIPAILEGLQKEPFHVDYLAVLSDHFMRQNDLAKVAATTGRLLDALANHKPDSLAPREWTAKRERYLGQALWMNGVVNSVLGSYSQADRSLRGALPYLRGNAGLLAAGLYHLGFVNYKLAQSGEPNRVFEALKFNQECAQIQGAYQEQASKNILAIKSEYSVP